MKIQIFQEKNRYLFSMNDFTLNRKRIPAGIVILTIIFSFFALQGIGFAQTKDAFPKPQGYVTDLAGLLTPQSIDHLTGLIRFVKQQTTAEIAVVTVKSMGSYTIEDYAVRLFETWGIGTKAKDNGVLLIVALRERKIRIEVGYGLEGAITDGTGGRIIREIITPSFKNGQFDQGIVAGTEAILRLVATEYQMNLPENLAFRTHERIRPKGSSGITDLFIFLISLLFLFIIFRSGLWPFLLFGSPFGGSGWSRGSGGFGGFGGFGGGMSGGGGASGSW